MCLSLSLSLSFSLSFSLRRWGNPNLFGLGFPLCFRGHNLLLRPVLRGRHLHQGLHPHLPFFLSTSLVSLVVVGCGLLCLIWASLSLSRWFGCIGCLHARISQREGVAYKTAPPFIIIIIVFWGCEHGAVSRTFRPEPLVLPPPPPAVP